MRFDLTAHIVVLMADVHGRGAFSVLGVDKLSTALHYLFLVLVL